MCFRCGKDVAAGAGFFQRMKGAWVVRCGWCVGKGNKRVVEAVRPRVEKAGTARTE
jgi:hypothetical protein